MEWFIIPISLFTKNINYTLPSVLATLPIYVFAVMMLYRCVTVRGTFSAIMVNRKVLTITLINILAQLVMIIYSYNVTNQPENTSGLSTGPVNVFLFFGNIFFVYYFMSVIIKDDASALNFTKSILITLFVFSVLVLIPQAIATVSRKTDMWVNLMGRLFEVEHTNRGDFYWVGSYTTTMRRINGFSSEAAYFSAQIGIVFIPFILAAIKNHFDYFKNARVRYVWKYLGLLLFLFLILLLAKTSTGILVIIIALLCLFVSAPKEYRRIYFVIGIVGLVLLAGLYQFVPYVHALLTKYLFAKQGTGNRVGGTIGLFKTFLHYPLFGAGQGYLSYYIFKFVPHATTLNGEFHFNFLKTGYPALSIWGMIFASFGLTGVVPLFIYLYNKIKLAWRIKKQAITSQLSNAIFYNTIVDSFYFTLVLFSVIAFFTFSWGDEIYLIIFFFYIVMLKRASKELNLER
ncbi:hypothetical protein AYR56_09960 [Loigolactobacillus backii]|uniref:O-antigen polymerase n=1 Tax=Loigolactobacillus backii TaxID=375175 RepID=A0A192H2N6_9LACO|nr:hypothetical protein [Loigolactobacillus backii]ANK62543.1 hypothetical protein AYR53_07040 [Loigolactobacillus backii]ANK70446.1 hypothetical protein AYR56_09960 [Loigolactobacillus backii]